MSWPDLTPLSELGGTAGSGRLPLLRSLSWDRDTNIGANAVTDVSSGQTDFGCPIVNQTAVVTIETWLMPGAGRETELIAER